jgi:hypothetical protein
LKTIFYLEGKMKKFIVALSLLLMACSEDTIDKTKFKNPVFNQPLEPLSSTVGYAYLTPTSAEFRGPIDKDVIVYQGKCDLIENKQDRITLKCKGYWLDTIPQFRSEHNSYLTYVVKDIFMSDCLRILEYDYDKPEDFPHDEAFAAKYCVTPPEEMLPRNN